MLTGAGLHLKGEFLSLPVMFRGRNQEGLEPDPSWLLVLRRTGLPPPKNLSTPLQNWCWLTHFLGMLMDWENDFRRPAQNSPYPQHTHKEWTLLANDKSVFIYCIKFLQSVVSKTGCSSKSPGEFKNKNKETKIGSILPFQSYRFRIPALENDIFQKDPPRASIVEWEW